MKIGVVGAAGCIGGAISYGMEKLGHDVIPHDITMDTSLSDLVDCEIAYICVPTPELPDGGCDTMIVESVISGLDAHGFTGIIAIKSTIVPGTTEKLIKKYSKETICFVPEFLRERHAISDFTENHNICVIGTLDRFVFEIIKESHGHYPQEFIQMSPTEAELAKYFSNVFNAMRVVFACGFESVCNKLGADYTKIKNAMVKRPTIENLYLDCNEKFRGFAGMCLTKDTAAFRKLAESLGVDAQIFRTIVEDNKLYTPTVFPNMRLK